MTAAAPRCAADALEWQHDPPAAEWDQALAALSGHPLQSCLWGDARLAVDGIVQHRWLGRHDGIPTWMIRLEERRLVGDKIAWAPRGPTARTAALALAVPQAMVERLKADGFSLLVTDPWVQAATPPAPYAIAARPARPRTIWLDLLPGRDALFANAHAHIRKGVRRAARAGIRVETTADAGRIAEFVALCGDIGHKKGFASRATPQLISALQRRADDDSEAVQFVSLKDDKLVAGLFVLRLGRNVHQIFGGTDRAARQDRVGEACQWAVIEWAIARGCTRYDLEGIDPDDNPSVYRFKKRLGGEEIVLCGHLHTPLGLSGRALSRLIRLKGR